MKIHKKIEEYVKSEDSKIIISTHNIYCEVSKEGIMDVKIKDVTLVAAGDIYIKLMALFLGVMHFVLWAWVIAHGSITTDEMIIFSVCAIVWTIICFVPLTEAVQLTLKNGRKIIIGGKDCQKIFEQLSMIIDKENMEEI